jgi:hypothetical protein
MMKRVVRTAVALVTVLVVVGCGSSDNADVAPSTTGKVKNSAVTTTVAPATTLAPTTTLAPSDSAATPRPTLPAEATPDSAAGVPDALQTDGEGILTVASSTWRAGDGPRRLVWSLSARGRTIDCIDCAYVAASTKRVIAAVLADPVGDAVTAVFGFDPSAGAGDYRSNGWAAEFVVGTGPDAPVAGDAIQRWVLECPADGCRSQQLNIAEMRWTNRVWSVSDCATALKLGGPSDLSGTSVSDGAGADTLRESALDRVVLSSPHYRPVLVADAGSRTIGGYAGTGCAS